MFVLRPSSPVKIAQLRTNRPAEADAEVAAAAPEAGQTTSQPLDAEPFMDLGLPIPDTYHRDLLRALMQDPFRVFIYWEVRDDNLKALTNYFSPAEVKTFRTVLKLRDLTNLQEAFFPVSNRGRYWMMVFPDRTYEFEIGVRSPAHGYISLLRSNRVQTPRGTVSPVTADEAEYHLEPAEFLAVMEKSGFGAEQSLDITVAAMPGNEISEDLLHETMHKLSNTLRETIELALAGGKLTTEMIGGLPESMRESLLALLRESGGEVASAGLMHYLPELLRETLEDEREWVADQTHPLHVSPRFFAGASEMTQVPFEELNLPKPPRRWRPGAGPSSDEWMQNPVLISSGPSRRRLLTDRS